MRYSYREPKTEGTLNLLCHETNFGRHFFRERQERLLTIARDLTKPLRLIA